MSRTRDIWSLILSKKLFFSLVLFFIVSATLVSIFGIKGNEVLWFAERRNPVLNQIFLLITILGEEYGFIIMIILLILFRSYRKSMEFALTGTLTMLISFLSKIYFKMPRPYLYFSSVDRAHEMAEIPNYDFHVAFTSFPSGHTMGAFSFFTLMLFLLNHKLYELILFILAALAGISRIYLGQHFIGDVAAGAFVGVCIAVIVHYFINHTFRDNKILDRSLLNRSFKQ